MRLNKEALSTRVVVRRAKVGAARFKWEINSDTRTEPLFVSPESYGCMESAYQAGRARLPEFITVHQPAMTEMEAFA